MWDNPRMARITLNLDFQRGSARVNQLALNSGGRAIDPELKSSSTGNIYSGRAFGTVLWNCKCSRSVLLGEMSEEKALKEVGE